MTHRISRRWRSLGAVLGVVVCGLVISGPIQAKAGSLPNVTAADSTGMTIVCTAAQTAGASCPILWTGGLPAAQTSNPSHITISRTPPPGVVPPPPIKFDNQVQGDCGTSDIYIVNPDPSNGTMTVQFGAGSTQGVITDVWYGMQYSDSDGNSFESDNSYSWNSDGWNDQLYVSGIPADAYVGVELQGGVEIDNGNEECSFNTPTASYQF